MKSVAKIKRSFSLLLVFCMLMAAVVPAVYAQGSTVKLKVNSVEAKPGQEVEVSIELTENPGIWGLDFGVAYDSEVLTLKKCEDKGLLPDKLHGEDLSANPYILLWTNSADEDTTGTGTLVVLTFEVSETAADNSETKIEINEPTAPSWVETAERPVEVTNGTVTIKAAPVVNEYTVTFNSNGGSAVASQKVKDGETATKPADPTRTGFTFKGWYSDAGLTSAFNFNTAITKDTTLYAKWEENAVVNEYTVTFNSNGGSAVASQKVKDGETATKPADPTRTGFTFKGWYSDAGLTSAFNFNTAITKDTTLYAKWEENAVVNEYTVTFNSNGGSAVASQKVKDGETATKPADPTRTGFTFKGWYSDAGLTSAFNFNTAITKDTTLYAKWEENAVVNEYTVTFNSNGGSAVASQKVKDGETATKPADPTRTGFTFKGWYSDAGLTSAFNFNTAITKDTTLYAKWEENAVVNEYTVTFNSNGGSAVASQKVKDGETATKPADPTRTGFTFKGWYSDAGLTSAFNFNTAITKDTTLYAKWEENAVVNEYTVTFNSNGGSAVASQKVKDGETATKPADPTRTGFTFKGWYSDAGLTSAFNFNTAITKDTTLYAKWEENAVVNEYTVTFNSNGGSAVASQKVKDGETATKPADPTRTGFTFKGWYSDAGLTSAFNFNTAITKDTTLYAKWEKVSPEDPATEDPATEDPATEDPATETPGTLVERFFGKDRILTAIALSKKYIKADSVVIAHARKYPDALTASVLAYALDGPILLTDTGIISADVLAELDRLGVSNIYVVGGINSVSDDVAQSYAEGRTMTRLGGADRYATAGLVADKVTELEGTKGMAFIASGENYPDALAVSSPAAQSGAPILLVQKDSLPEDTQNAMTRNGIVKTMVIGGENSISEEVEKALPDVQKRLEGKDRYETAHAVAKHFNAKASVAFLASGEVFADALSAGPMAAKKSAPMLLTPKAELKPATLTYLKEAGVNQVTVVGGPDSVSNAVLRAIK